MTADRDRLTAARAEHAELRAALMRGELVKAADVEAEWSRAILESRGVFMGWPARFAGRFGLSPAQARALDVEVRDMLQTAADRGGAHE
jgi:phage terminase Nu1 subunit (DNA packaging protein)